MSDAPTGPDQPGAVVIGGGLAGMVAALRLAEAGLPVDLYEAADRLGGKAGSDRRGAGEDAYLSDHGYHVFPAWYTHTWALIDQLGIRGNFQRRRLFWRLAVRRARTCPAPGWRLRARLRLASLAPRSLLIAVDLVSRPEQELVGQSLADFIETRSYKGPGTGDELRDISLKGLGNPPEEASAITFRANMRLLLPTLHRANWTAANGPLQERLIDPIAEAMAAAGVAVHPGAALAGISLTADSALTGLRFAGGDHIDTVGRPVVLALPVEVLRGLLAADQPARPDALARLDQLESRPMVAFDVHLRRRLRGLPRKGHLILDGSTHHLTLLDLRKVWRSGLPGPAGRSVLQVIAADTEALGRPADPVLQQAVMDDLRSFFPYLTDDDIERVELHANGDTPLFMNVVGTDHARPPSDRAHGPNLYVAGDWCRTPIELACMEGAVVSGTAAAHAVLRDHGGTPDDLRLPGTGPSRRARVIRGVAVPILRLLSWPVDRYRRRHRR